MMHSTTNKTLIIFRCIFVSRQTCPCVNEDRQLLKFPFRTKRATKGRMLNSSIVPKKTLCIRVALGEIGWHSTARNVMLVLCVPNVWLDSLVRTHLSIGSWWSCSSKQMSPLSSSTQCLVVIGVSQPIPTGTSKASEAETS
jgi:hypothetical protein